MPYDIYGQSLRSGHCEVHPDVHEPYPCSLCYVENEQAQKERDDYERATQEQKDVYYAEQRLAMISDIENIDGDGI